MKMGKITRAVTITEIMGKTFNIEDDIIKSETIRVVGALTPKRAEKYFKEFFETGVVKTAFLGSKHVTEKYEMELYDFASRATRINTES